MPSLNREIQAIAARLLPNETPNGKPATLLQAVVAGVSLGRLDVYLSGSTFPVSGIRYLSSYRPVVGELVWLVRSGGDTWCLGALQPKPGNPPIEPWRLIGAAGEPTFQNSWVAFGSPYGEPGFAMQSDGWVHLKGLAKNGTDAATIFTLPVGYRPPMQLALVAESNNAACRLDISTAGVVNKVVGGSNAHVSFDGLMFPTAEGWDKIRRDMVQLSNEGGFIWIQDNYGYPEIYMRPDGLCWIKGSVSDGTAPAYIAVIPQGCRVRQSLMLAGMGFGVARIDVQNEGHFRHMVGSGAGIDTFLTALNYWSLNGLAHQNWNNFAFANGWVNHTTSIEVWQTGTYQMDAFGVVHIRGMINGTAKTSNIFGNLPAGYRPLEKKVFGAIRFNASGGVPGRIDVYPNGDMEAVGAVANWHSVNGMFKAEQ